MRFPDLLALDFDGVICDGLREYFQTSWRAYCQLWHSPGAAPPEGLAEAFYRLRPVVETGWEMPVVLYALESGFSEAEILRDWHNLSLELLSQHRLEPRQVAAIVDGIRDSWIAQDLDRWLAEHRFYPGVVDRLKTLEQFVIISTKEARFIRALLAQAGITLREDQVFGKEQKRPKHEILRELQPHHDRIWFVEDRLKTLQGIEQQADLAEVGLFLADWGYNLPRERELAQTSDRIHLISLAQWDQDFGAWC